MDSIIRDLVDIAVKMMREEEMKKCEHIAEEAAEERILDALLPPPRGQFAGEPHEPDKDQIPRHASISQKIA